MQRGLGVECRGYVWELKVSKALSHLSTTWKIFQSPSLLCKMIMSYPLPKELKPKYSIQWSMLIGRGENPDVMAYVSYPSMCQTEAKRSQVQDQPRALLSKTVIKLSKIKQKEDKINQKKGQQSLWRRKGSYEEQHVRKVVQVSTAQKLQEEAGGSCAHTRSVLTWWKWTKTLWRYLNKKPNSVN